MFFNKFDYDTKIHIIEWLIRVLCDYKYFDNKDELYKTSGDADSLKNIFKDNIVGLLVLVFETNRNLCFHVAALDVLDRTFSGAVTILYKLVGGHQQVSYEWDDRGQFVHIMQLAWIF